MNNNPTVTLILLFLLKISISHAQEEPIIENSIPPSSVPTSVATSSGPSLQESQSPSAAPSTSFQPTATILPTNSPFAVSSLPPSTLFTSSPTNENCQNDPNFFVAFWDYYDWDYHAVNLTCDDDRLSCHDWSDIGPATDYCCKCKFECSGQCNNDPVYTPPPPDDDCVGCDGPYDYDYYDDDDYYNGGVPAIVIIFFVGFGMVVCVKILYRFQGRAPERRAVQQTMTARRQQQRENNTQGLTVEERNNARYELFVTKFHFQAVLPDKSNITANSVRDSASNKPDEEHPTKHHHHDDVEESSVAGPIRQNSLSERLSSWRRPSAKDECCICLECYTEGETICAPMTTECNHVFHEGCILEWLKTKDHCPLCRVELLKD